MVKRILLPIFILFIFVNSTFAMAPVLSRASSSIAKSLTNKAVDKACNELKWAIATLPCWNEPYKYTKSIVIDALNSRSLDESVNYDEPSERKEWLQKELRDQGYPDWHKVILVPYGHFAAGRIGLNDYLFYDPIIIDAAARYDSITKLLAQLDSNDHWERAEYTYQQKQSEYYGNLARGILTHEKTHIEKNHTQKAALASLCIPLLTSLSMRTFAPTSSAGGIKNNVLKIASGVAQLITNMGAIWSLKYFHEKEADDAVIKMNNPDVLFSLSAWFTAQAEKHTQIHQNDSLRKKINYMLDPHPATVKRIERFTKHAEQLLREKKAAKV